MQSLPHYKDLLLEIDNLNLLLRELIRRERDLYSELGPPRELKAYDTAKETAPRVARDAERVLPEWIDVQHKRIDCQKKLNALLELKLRIDRNLEQLTGLDLRVVKLRDVDGLTMQEIAGELGYSEVWIKKISARNPRG